MSWICLIEGGWRRAGSTSCRIIGSQGARECLGWPRPERCSSVFLCLYGGRGVEGGTPCNSPPQLPGSGRSRRALATTILTPFLSPCAAAPVAGHGHHSHGDGAHGHDGVSCGHSRVANVQEAYFESFKAYARSLPSLARAVRCTSLRACKPLCKHRPPPQKPMCSLVRRPPHPCMHAPGL